MVGNTTFYGERRQVTAGIRGRCPSKSQETFLAFSGNLVFVDILPSISSRSIHQINKNKPLVFCWKAEAFSEARPKFLKQYRNL